MKLTSNAQKLLTELEQKQRFAGNLAIMEVKQSEKRSTLRN